MPPGQFKIFHEEIDLKNDSEHKTRDYSAMYTYRMYKYF